jgi:hypothetical protein
MRLVRVAFLAPPFYRIGTPAAVFAGRVVAHAAQESFEVNRTKISDLCSGVPSARWPIEVPRQPP